MIFSAHGKIVDEEIQEVRKDLALSSSGSDFSDEEAPYFSDSTASSENEAHVKDESVKLIKKYLQDNQTHQNYFAKTKKKVTDAKQTCAEALRLVNKRSEKLKRLFCKSKQLEETLGAYETELDKLENDLADTELFVYKCDKKKNNNL